MELNFMFLAGIGLVKVSSFNMNVVKENNHFQHLKKKTNYSTNAETLC